MRKIKRFDIVAIISTIGMIGWLVTDFFGGMIIYLLSYGLLIIPIIILYLISIVETLRNWKSRSKIKILFHFTVILTIIFLNLYHSDILKSKRVMTATLKDDLFYYTLIFRKNGTCENNISGFMGFSQTFKGKYITKGDTIIFKKKPYNNDFIPDTLLVDKNEKAIFIEKEENGKFRRTKEWLNHFEIE
jgi:hypothetical protein